VILDYKPDGSPLKNKPLPAPDPPNDADLIAQLAKETRELRAQLAEARAKATPDTAVPVLMPVEAYADEYQMRAVAEPAAGREKSGRPPIEFRHLADIVAEDREPAWLIHNILEREVLAILAGPRSTFKSFLAFHWLMTVAADNLPGAYLSGEGAGLDRRAAAWMREHGNGADLRSLPVVALERPLNLNLAVEMEELRQAFEAMPRPPVLIVIDTLSKFAPGLKENDNGEVAAYLASLALNLRDAFNATVLLVVHSGHGETGRPRGASALMANPDAEYIVQRPSPTAMTITVSRERFKDGPALDPLAYEAKVIDLERRDSYGDPVTSLVLHSTGAPPQRPKLAGKYQGVLDTALKEFKRTHPQATHISSIDMTALCKAQGIPAKRRREVFDSFVNARVLSPSVGGYTFHGENL
jgi:AAA domain